MSNKAVEDVTHSMNVFLNVFPENGKTHILFSYFPRNEAFTGSIDKMFSQYEEKVKISLSNIILNYVENLAFNPAYISNYFSEEELREVKSAYIENISNPNSFTKVNINLFRNSL